MYSYLVLEFNMNTYRTYIRNQKPPWIIILCFSVRETIQIKEKGILFLSPFLSLTWEKCVFSTYCISAVARLPPAYYYYQSTMRQCLWIMSICNKRDEVFILTELNCQVLSLEAHVVVIWLTDNECIMLTQKELIQKRKIITYVIKMSSSKTD